MFRKMVDNSITNLEQQRKKAIKKIDKTIEARHKEVFAAKDAIAKMESIIEGLQRKNKNQKEKSDRDISELQEGIKILNGELKEYREKEENDQKFLNKQRAEKTKKVMDNINTPIQDPQTKIKALQDLVNQLEFNLKFTENSRDQRALELKHEKEAHATTKTNTAKDLEAEKTEHEATKST